MLTPPSVVAKAYDWSQFQAPEWCVPIRANVMTFDWDVSCSPSCLKGYVLVMSTRSLNLESRLFQKLAEACQFDVILMDPPWQLTSAQPTRGVGNFSERQFCRAVADRSRSLGGIRRLRSAINNFPTPASRKCRSKSSPQTASFSSG